MVRSGIVFVFRSCQQGCGLQNQSLARITIKGISKIIVTPNYFVICLAGMVYAACIFLDARLDETFTMF